MARALTVLGQGEERRERADAQKNRARILDAARRLTKKRPLDELCMDELAACAGVGKGTLYRRFADKTALLHALLDESERALQVEVKQTLGRRGLDPHVALTWLLDELFAFAVHHARILAAAEASARGSALYESAPYRWRHAVVSQQLVRAGIVHGDGAAQLADMLLAGMAGELVVRALTNRTPEEVQAQARVFFASVLSVRGAS